MQQSAHILVVEDDADIRRMIAEFLRRNGYRVQTAHEGGELDRILEVSRIDLLILDIGLPQEDGLSLCRRIRTQSTVPIIMLTARGSELERVTGLESGADDYLTKPFAVGELLARLEALARRAQGANSETTLVVDDLTLDLLSRKVTRAGRAVTLQPREFKLLEYLMRHANQVVTRTMLLESVWDYHFDPQTNVVDVHVSKLRQKIDAGTERPLLKTIRNAGYMLAADG
jgi:two-component system OmpR family response regulator